MRVGLNATCFNDRPSGAKQRFCGIYGALIRRRPDIEFVVYEPSDCRVAHCLGDAANVRPEVTPLPSTGRAQRLVRGLAYWPTAFKSHGLDLFENSHLPMVKAPGCPTILTMHDIRDGLPGSPPLKRALYLRILRHALGSADHVISVSDTIRAELLAHAPRARITTIYNGIDPTLFSSASTNGAAAALGNRLGLPQPFLLAVGHLEARKNYLKLVEAIGLLDARAMGINLVIVGNDGGEKGRITEELRRLRLSDRVRILSGVTNEELSALYAMSSAVVFPSRYEGFGIPILEAMAAARPLILSDIPAFQELTEGQCVYFDPVDAQSMAEAIGNVLRNHELGGRLVEYGKRRVADFEFDTLAAQVEQVYQTCLSA